MHAKFALSLILLIAAAGCASTETKLNTAKAKADEKSRQLTTGIVDVLGQQKYEPQRRIEAGHALAVLDQGIEGLPIERIDAKAVLEGQGSKALAKDVADIRTGLDAAITADAVKEKPRERSSWLGWAIGIVGSLGIGGTIALVLLFPAAAPIVGRVLGWLIEAVPKLSGWFGLVSLRAFDAVVKGVGSYRQAVKVAKAVTPGLPPIDSHLRLVETAGTKRLVDERRKVHGV